MRRTRNRSRNKNKKIKVIFNKKIITLLVILLALILFSFFIWKIIHKNKKTENISNNNIADNFIDNSTLNNENTIIDNSTQNVDTEDSPTTFEMTAIGDSIFYNTHFTDAYDKENQNYDFSYIYDDINYYTKTSDITIGSLCTTFSGENKGYNNNPSFNSPDILATNLKKIGVDVLSLANNHALDYGYEGLCRTIDVLDDVNIAHLGTYKTEEEQNKILLRYVKGVKIAFINYTYGTNNTIPSDKQFCINLIDKNLIKKQIEQAKEHHADIIVACIHWGTDYSTTINQEQVELTDFLFENGVDIILGNHPQVLEPMEKRTITLEDGTTKDGFVIYSLGSFTTDINNDLARSSIILNLTITKGIDGKISIDKVKYVPIYMYKNANTKTHKFKIINITKTISNYDYGIDTSIGHSIYNNLKTQLEKIKKIVGNEIN